MGTIRKIGVMAAIFAFCAVGAVAMTQDEIETEKSTTFTDKLIMYFPNRLVDLADTFSVDLGVGTVIGVNANVTRAFGIDAKYGPSGKMIKDYNRQYGFALDQGYWAQFMCFGKESMQREYSVGSVNDYWLIYTGMPYPSEDIFNIKTGKVDYWEISVGAACFADVRFAVHPIDIADFVTGLFFYDLKGDDISIHQD